MRTNHTSPDSVCGVISRRLGRATGCLFLLVAILAGEGRAAGLQENAGPVAKPEDQLDLVDRKPFDQITLDDQNYNEKLDILPLLKPPTKPYPEKEVLVFQLAEEPSVLLEVPFVNVVDFKTFDQLLLDEAETLIKTEEYSKAFRNLLYVYDNSGRDADLLARINEVLFYDAKKNYDTGQFGLALSMFEDLYTRDPRFTIPGVEKKSIDLILDCYDRLLQQKQQDNEWANVRGLMDSVRRKYHDLADPLLVPWQERLVQVNRDLQAQTTSMLADRKFLEARITAGKALQVLPEDANSLQLMQDVLDAWPLLFVGVSQPAFNPDPQRIDDWASRRVGRLTERRLMELTGFSDEGGKYLFPNGKFVQADELGMVYRFELDDVSMGNREVGIPPLEAHQLATLLLEYANPDNPDRHVPWARVLKTVSVLDSRTVEVRLNAPFVRPEAVLQLPYTPPGFSVPAGTPAIDNPAANGPYVITDQNSDRSLFQANPKYVAQTDQQNPEIAEWNFGTPSEAVDALLRGDVDVVDRIPSGDLKKLKALSGIEVRPYAVPTMHMLVPNQRNEFTKQAMFRIGLLRTIDRNQILDQMICHGLEIDGSVVLDSPFPVGTDDNDQIAYAIDPTIRVADNNYLLGQLLVLGEQERQVRAQERKGIQNAEIPLPELVLAYPKNEVAAIACNAIAAQWRQINIRTRLRELAPGETRPPDDDYDFLYLEVACTEPLSDADSLFGMEGLVPEVNPTVEQIVRLVNTSASWRQVSTNLRMLHRQTMNSVAVLPLYQLREHFAFRTGVRGIGRDLIFLYQQVDRWSVGSGQEIEQ